MRFPQAVKKFLLGYLVLHLLAAGFFVLVLTRLVRNQMTRDAQARMSAMTTLLAEHIDELEDGLDDQSLVAHIKKIGEKTNMRFTLIRSDGVVVADSITGKQDIGDHGDREEVLIAKQDGIGFSERYSNTLEKPMIYFAQDYQPSNRINSKALEDDSTDIRTLSSGFVRVASPADFINQSIKSIQRYVWLFALALSALTALLMSIFSARSLSPLGIFSEAARKIGLGQYEKNSAMQTRQDEWGQLARAFNQMKDEITQREERLVENTHRLEAVLSSMIEGVLSINSVGDVMMANNAACKMLSIPLSNLKGRKLLDIVRIPELQGAITKTQLQRTFSKTEFQTLTPPSRLLSARVSVLANEAQPGVAVVLHDVTELRQLETMRQDFVANVSHELKTPLASIKAYAETLRLGALHDNEKNLQFVQRIETQAEQLDRQIQDLMEIAKVESGKAIFRMADMSLSSVCKDSLSLLQEMANKSEVQLIFNEPNEPIEFKSDREAVATIIKNLVLNAIRYTPAGGSVTLDTKQEENAAVIKVIDTGIGISADQQKRVFERFYRVDRARSRDKGGTGLGLAIVKHLSQALGGSVSLESQVGKGSSFEVRLPMNPDHEMSDP